MDKTKQEFIDEFNELIRSIPIVERLMYHRFEEIKEMLWEEIYLYREAKLALKTNQPETSPDEKKTGTTGEPYHYHSSTQGEKRTPIYQFQLDRNQDGQWLPTFYESPLPPHVAASDILPLAIIQYISTFTPNQNKIEVRKRFTLPALNGRIFDLSFTRFTHHQVLGTICEIKKEEDEISVEPPPKLISSNNMDDTTGYENIIDIKESYKNLPEGSNYRLLYYYMEKYPILKKNIFSEFFLKWKPLLDNHAIESQTE